jgi:succinate-acetate transporter protein
LQSFDTCLFAAAYNRLKKYTLRLNGHVLLGCATPIFAILKRAQEDTPIFGTDMKFGYGVFWIYYVLAQA